MMNNMMKTPSGKFAIGTAVLLLSGMLWIAMNASSSEPFTKVEIDWETFPVVSEISIPQIPAQQARAVLVFGPTDCHRYREQISQWAKVVQERASIDMVGAITVPYELAGRRYTQYYGLPFPVMLDSLAWFEQHFDLNRKPALILWSQVGKTRVIYLDEAVASETEIKQHLDELL